ncbi:hypothetical protein L211DRAFT_610481 [Terfezia boudieri ATCC MYA-4762]|uniref:Uncharacterized protein n=1 Tax=Terfezia boudieri ATCC MYA-4762 TaxID=1051890 RepID=A0A3N4M183_9PEZI|nr:hypothetical protein L211DRAFT_610481 [Terfezia boudieri ATCC MYA-4762]
MTIQQNSTAMPLPANVNYPPARTKPLSIRCTPPVRHSFDLPSKAFFTGSLFDSIAIFLQKYSIQWHNIQCVARGVHPDTAIPTICILITSPSDMDHVAKLWQEYNQLSSSGMESLAAIVPDEIMEVEFASVIADLVAAPDFRNSNSSGATIAGFLGQGPMGASIAGLSMVGASVRNAVAGRSEVPLLSCNCCLNDI